MKQTVKGKKIINLKHFLLGIFSGLFSAFFVVGYHIQGDMLGTSQELFFSEYKPIDVMVFVALFFGVFFLLSILENRWDAKGDSKNSRFRPVMPDRYFWIMAVVLFVLWVPYFIVYYPGMIYGDSYTSIREALGKRELQNHFPVLYTLFIKCCLAVGRRVKDLAFGCGIYTVIQMVVLSLGLGFILRWSQIRLGLGKILTGVLLVLFGCMPYFAMSAISMWKDPMFSIFVVVYSILLYDFIASEGQIGKEKWFLPLLFVLVLGIMFLRNNGVYVIASVTAVLWILGCREKIARKYLVYGVTVFAIGIYLIVTGPVFRHFGILPSEKVESYGIFLNQMARVVVCDGDMSEDDLAYMDAMLPLEKYETCYHPGLVDPLKWDDDFHSEVIDEGFFGHYFSMLKKNPKIYMESWILETYGFYTVSQSGVYQYTGSFLMGGLRDHIQTDTLKNEIFDVNACREGKRVLSPVTKTIPVGMLLWWTLWLFCFAVIRRHKPIMILLLPGLLVVATLFVATPIAYWPRYALCLQYLLPILLGLIGCKHYSGKTIF